MLYYEKCGTGPTVVLLHGLPCDHHIWNDLTSKLSNRFTFILPDFPGAGESPEDLSAITLKDIALAVSSILDKENILQTIVAGHSMGGYTALAFAKMFPERTKAISLIHSSSAADTEEKKQNRLKSMALIRKGEDAKKVFIKALILNLFDNDFKTTHAQTIQESINKGNLLSSNTLIRWYEALMNREDTTPILQNADFPIQWILGENDNATHLNSTLKLAHIAGFNDICIYKNCGHMSMLEKPEKLSQDLERFWRYVDEL